MLRPGSARLRRHAPLGGSASAAARRSEQLGVPNRGLKGSLQYKRAYFLDWRVCDRLKSDSLARWDFLLDTTVPDDPKLVTGAALRAGLEQAARRPFRVVPFFDPAPWGGQWMREVCGLDGDAAQLRLVFRLRPRGKQPAARLRRDDRVEIPSVNMRLPPAPAVAG